GILEMDTGRPAQAEKDYGQAAEILQELKKQFPQAPEYSHELARCYLDRGVLLREDSSRAREAAEDYDGAVRLLRDLVRRFPVRRDYRYELAVGLIHRGNLLLGDAARRADAEADYREALALCGQLVRDFPVTPRYKYELANCHNSLAGVLSYKKDLGGAEKEWLLALPIFEGLVARPSAGADYYYGLGMTLGNLGWLQLQRQQYAEARRLLESGVGRLNEALKLGPEHRGYL